MTSYLPYARRIAVLLVDGFSRDRVVPLLDCLRGRGARVTIAGFRTHETLTSTDAREQIICELAFAEIGEEHFDAVMVADDVTARAVRNDTDAMALVAATWGHGDLVVTVGEGAAALIGAGIANNKSVSAPPELHASLREAGAEIAETPITFSNNVISAAPEADLATLCERIASSLGGEARAA